MTAARVFAVVGAACVAAVAVALVSQYRFDMQPCPWCVLQRLILLMVAAVCVVGLVWRSAIGRVVSGSVALLLALCGLAAALWQHFQAAASASCNLTLADRIVSGWLGLDALLPDVFSARASCADAAVSLLGVPYDFWSAALFTLVGLAIALGVLRRR
jgi:disulfide bond formation protein DsbB